MKKIIIVATALLSFFILRSLADTYTVTASDKIFFDSIRTAILTNDVEGFAEMVAYPFVFKSGNTEYKVENKKKLIRSAPLIFTPNLKIVVQKQSRDLLFKNWQGVRIGDGEIWFSQIDETIDNEKTWKYRIIAINLPAKKAN